MRTIYYAIAIIILSVFQTTLFHHFQFFGVKPLLLFAFAVIIAMQRGLIEGGLVGLACGFVTDMLVRNAIGTNALLFLYVCIICSLLSENFFKEKRIVIALFVFISNLVYGVVYFFMVFLIWGQGGFFRFFVQIILIESLYTTAVAIPIFLLHQRINQKFAIREGG